MCFWGEGEEVLLSFLTPSLQRSFEKSEERPLLAHTPPFFRGDRVALLAEQHVAEQSHHIFLVDKERQQRGLLEHTESFFSECHRKRNHYESVLKAYSLLRKGLLKNVGCMPKTASQSNREIIKALCKDPHLLPLAVAVLHTESFRPYPLKSCK